VHAAGNPLWAERFFKAALQKGNPIE